MAKKMLIDAAHPEETRVVVVHGNRIEEFDFESAAKKQLRGNIYLAKVTRVEPSLQAAFVDYGGNRHGFLAFSEIHPDYYQIPVADRQALLEEQAAEERRLAEEEDWTGPETGRRNARRSDDRRRGGRRRQRRRSDRITCRIREVEDDTLPSASGSADLEQDWSATGDTGAVNPEVALDAADAFENGIGQGAADPEIYADDPETTTDAVIVETSESNSDDSPAAIVMPETAEADTYGEDPDRTIVEVTAAEESEDADSPSPLASQLSTVDIESMPRGRRGRGFRNRSSNGETGDQGGEAETETDEDDATDAQASSDDMTADEAEDADLSDDDEENEAAAASGADDDAQSEDLEEDGDQDGMAAAADTDETDEDETIETSAQLEDDDSVEAQSDIDTNAGSGDGNDAETGTAETETEADGEDTRIEAAPLRQAPEETQRSEPIEEPVEQESETASQNDEQADTGSFEGDSVDRVRQLLKKSGALPPKKATPEPQEKPEDFLDEYDMLGDLPPAPEAAPAPESRTEPDPDDDLDMEAEAAEVVETAGGEDILEDEQQRRKVRVRNYKIQEVIKRRQILLIQVVKEERGNKGAALTTYLSIAGRYCVLMPNTARGGGISRKITNPADRKRLKEVAGSLEVPEGMGLIVRTAGANRTKTEVKRDYEYLLRLWENVRDLTLKSTAPTLVYEESNLVKRSIRDLYGKDIDNIQVEGEESYKEAKAFMKMLMPSHAKNVQPYRDRIPLFQRYQVETHLDSMFSPTVELPAGGYLVINPTEALVSIDVNSGKSTKEHSIEETALRTNLEAAEEVARQLRLRDLAGLIVIDFIDMEEHRNNRAVEKKLKECLKTDRARLQIGRISAFGLLEMSRQRLRAGVLEGSTQICPHCEGSGKIRSVESSALRVLRACEEEGLRARSATAEARLPTDVAIYVLNNKRRQLMDIEDRYGLMVTIVADPTMLASDFTLQRGEPLTKENRPPRLEDTAVSMETAYDDTLEDDDADVQADSAESDAEDDADDGRGRRRGRRGRRRRSDRRDENEEVQADAADDADFEDEESVEASSDDDAARDEDENGDRPRRRRRRGKRGGRRNRRTASADTESTDEAAADAADVMIDTTPDAGDDVNADIGEDGTVETEMSLDDEAGQEIRLTSDPQTDEAPEGLAASVTAPEDTQSDYTNGHERPQEAENDLLSSIDPDEEHLVSVKPVASDIEEDEEPETVPEPDPTPPKPKRSGWWQKRA